MGKVWVTISQIVLIQWVLLHFPVLWEIDEKTHAFPIWWSISWDGKRMGKNTHTMGKVWLPISQVYSTQWLLLHFLVLWEIDGNIHAFSHMTKYTIGWESDGKKVRILWEKYDYQFPRFSPYSGFCCIFPYYGKLMGIPMHFPYDEVYHRMGIGWEKSTHTMGKVWLPISQVLPIRWVLLHFPMLWEIDGKSHAFPIWWDSLIFFCVSLILTGKVDFEAPKETQIQSPTTVTVSSCYDIGETVSLGGLEKLFSHEKYSILKNHFKPYKTYVFPKVHLHGCQRSCKIEYLHSSFVYSKKEDAVYCINCALFSPTDKQRALESFVTTGYKGWNNIHEKQTYILVINITMMLQRKPLELSQSLRNQIIPFHIKPMTPLRKDKKLIQR